MKGTEAQTVKNRRPAVGKEKPMKNTKAKLLKTAARLFASRGTEGVSTRELAGQAGVNLCAISYYFGSKQKLYEAVMFRIHKEALLRRMKIKQYTPELLNEIKKHIEENCDAILEQARRQK